MASLFSSIVRSPGNPTSRLPPSDDREAEFKYDPDAHGPVVEEPDLRNLNNALRALAELFPDVLPEVFREMLTKASPSSRLQIVTEQLLKNDSKWIQGRYRRTTPSRLKPVKDEADIALATTNLLPREATFRNADYKTAVKVALYDEFKGLSHSVIKAVLAEHNHHYTTTRHALLDIASTSWKVSVSNFLFRRKMPSNTSHPFINWITPKDGNKNKRWPSLTPSGNVELDREIYDTLIAPVYAQEKEARFIVDHAVAHQLQESDAHEASEEYDCEVCYSTVTIHKLAVCDDGGHYICFRCISYTINEAIYGQGWIRSIHRERGTMRCVAPVLDGSGDCNGCLPFEVVQRALEERGTGKCSLQTFEQRLSSYALKDAGLPLTHCPFCSYAEVDDLTQIKRLAWHFRNPREIQCISLWLMLLFFVSCGLFVLLLILNTLYLLRQIPYQLPHNPFHPSLLRLATKSRGLRFTCLSPSCSKKSCLRCHTFWSDPHTCYDKHLSSLQRSIEAAQTAAIKRVCPRCDLSFVKASGCNKLVCPCGYSMCYLCRAELHDYSHFCQHFRARGGKCHSCDKCDLYREEDEKEILKEVKKKVEREWWEGEGKALDRGDMRRSGALKESKMLDWRTWQGWLDEIVERFVVVKFD